jgi:hypothetical protein
MEMVVKVPTLAVVESQLAVLETLELLLFAT